MLTEDSVLVVTSMYVDRGVQAGLKAVWGHSKTTWTKLGG